MANDKRKKRKGAPPPVSPLADLFNRAARAAGEVFREPLSGFAEDLSASVKRRVAQTAVVGFTKGLVASRQVVVPAIRLLCKLGPALDMAARHICETDGQDWTILGEKAKEKYRDFAIAAVRGFDRFLMSDDAEDAEPAPDTDDETEDDN